MAVYCITGATGYIGSMLVKHIGQQEGNDKIIALVRNRDKAQKLFPAGVDIYPVGFIRQNTCERDKDKLRLYYPLRFLYPIFRDDSPSGGGNKKHCQYNTKCTGTGRKLWDKKYGISVKYGGIWKA